MGAQGRGDPRAPPASGQAPRPRRAEVTSQPPGTGLPKDRKQERGTGGVLRVVGERASLGECCSRSTHLQRTAGTWYEAAAALRGGG